MHPRTAGLALLAVLLGGPAGAQYTQRVSVDSSGAQGDSHSSSPAISADGRYVAFGSRAALVPGDNNVFADIYVRDRDAKTTARVSLNSAGAQVSGDSGSPSISGDGRFVAFLSSAPNLVAVDGNGEWDVFVRDRQTGTTQRVSVGSGGTEAAGASGGPSISADGRWVAFWSRAENLVANDTNGRVDVFVHDRQTGTTSRASVDASGAQSGEDAGPCAISGDGRFVAFQHEGALVPSDANGALDVYLRDLQAGTTVRVSVDVSGSDAAGSSQLPSISADGRYVAFESDAPDLVPLDANGKTDVFVRDLLLGITTRASVGPGGAEGDEISGKASISGDGRTVAFVSFATTLVPGDTNGPFQADAFLRDLDEGTTSRVNLGLSNLEDTGGADACAISADGANVAFDSGGWNLVPSDTNEASDVFVRDLLRGTGFTSVCEPGLAGVMVCPCGNPPLGPGRGCDNSSSTGGAVLLATGGAFLSEDTLAFTTTGERPTAASFLLQGTAAIDVGTVYGQGVRCMTGALRRLYHRAASGGSITVPDASAFDLPVSEQSAVLGSPIFAGESRWYLVAYRDPVVLGGCPAARTFNATQTGRVTWAP